MAKGFDMFDSSIQDPLERLKASLVLCTHWPSEQWDYRIMAAATPLAAEVTGRRTARITWSFPVEPWMCNAAGNIHGGAVASIFDNLTSFSIAAVSEPGFWETGGVSRTLSCTYLRPAPRGATMTLVVEVVHAGRTLMTLAGRMLDPEGRVTATCEHLKAFVEVKWNTKL